MVENSGLKTKLNLGEILFKMVSCQISGKNPTKQASFSSLKYFLIGCCIALNKLSTPIIHQGSFKIMRIRVNQDLCYTNQ